MKNEKKNRTVYYENQRTGEITELHKTACGWNGDNGDAVAVWLNGHIMCVWGVPEWLEEKAVEC